MQELVYRPYLEHLSDFDPDELPDEIKPVFVAVSEKLDSGEPIKLKISAAMRLLTFLTISGIC